MNSVPRRLTASIGSIPSTPVVCSQTVAPAGTVRCAGKSQADAPGAVASSVATHSAGPSHLAEHIAGEWWLGRNRVRGARPVEVGDVVGGERGRVDAGL